MGWIKRRINKEDTKHRGRLDWALIAEKKLISQILEWCYKNNIIEFKDSNLGLAVTDGGWINVIKLKDFLEGEKGTQKVKEI